MRDSAAGSASPASPGALTSLSPGIQAADLARPPPQIPDHELLDRIGRGAYGEVWLARNVVGILRAVKVLYRQDFGDEHPFNREFKGIQKFEPISRSHPGVVNILQIGRNETEGYFYYVMELADDAGKVGRAVPRAPHSEAAELRRAEDSPALPGTPDQRGARGCPPYQPRTLRSDLRFRGRLPFDECLQLGLSLTSALEHLHQHGLVHRDVKPSNIIFVDGQPKLADIGLVAGVDEAPSFVGTEGYIPPEGPGKPQADLYSLGIVLYVMSTGKRNDAFPEPRTDVGSDPEHQRWLELNAIIHTACNADPSERYQTAGDMHTDLLRLQAGESVRRRLRWKVAVNRGRQLAPLVALVLALMAAAVTFWPRGTVPTNVLPENPTPLFVLPLRSPPGDTVSEELAGRVTDALIDSLGLILGPNQVGPRKSGWLLKSEDEALRLAFVEQNAREALEGKMTVVSNRVVATLALYKTPTNAPVWTESFVGTTNEIIALDWAMLEGAVRRLKVEIQETARPRISQLLSNNLEALYWCRKGWELQESYSTPRLALAKEAFLRATELDPNYTGAHYGVLIVYRASFDKPYRDAWPDLRSRARIILQIDDTDWKARFRLAWARIVHDYDWERGMPEMEAVLQEWPDNAGEWAIYYRTIGRFEEARLAQGRQDALGVQRGPLLWHSVVAKYFERQYEETVQGGRRIQRVDPETHHGFLLEAWGLIALGDFPAAINAIRRGLSLHERQDLRGLLGYVYARAGEREKADDVLRELARLPYAQPYWVARIHAGLGNTNQALTWLEKAYEDRSELLVQVDIGMGGLRLDEAWDNLQAEPRFQELLRQTGLDTWPK